MGRYDVWGQHKKRSGCYKSQNDQGHSETV